MAVTAAAVTAVTAAATAAAAADNDTTSNHDSWWEATYVGALLRPFDPGKGCQWDARRGKAVLGVDLPFDRGKARGECSMEGDGLRAEGDAAASSEAERERRLTQDLL